MHVSRNKVERAIEKHLITVMSLNSSVSYGHGKRLNGFFKTRFTDATDTPDIPTKVSRHFESAFLRLSCHVRICG